MNVRSFFVGALLVAGVMPLAAHWSSLAGNRTVAVSGLRPAEVQADALARVDWPTHFRDRPLTPLPLSELELRFARRFPGAIARFSDGERVLILRRVDRPTRQLHPATDCFAALGYSIDRPRPSADVDGVAVELFHRHARRSQPARLRAHRGLRRKDLDRCVVVVLGGAVRRRTLVGDDRGRVDPMTPARATLVVATAGLLLLISLAGALGVMVLANGVLATAAPAWSTEVRWAGRSVRVSVPGLVRLSTAPGVAHLIDGRSLQTPAGHVSFRRDGAALIAHCAPCRWQHDALATTPLVLTSVELRAERSGALVTGWLRVDQCAGRLHGRTCGRQHPRALATAADRSATSLRGIRECGSGGCSRADRRDARRGRAAAVAAAIRVIELSG